MDNLCSFVRFGKRFLITPKFGEPGYLGPLRKKDTEEKKERQGRKEQKERKVRKESEKTRVEKTSAELVKHCKDCALIASTSLCEELKKNTLEAVEQVASVKMSKKK